MTFPSKAARSDSIKPLLRPDERLLWQGQPNLRAYSLRGSWYLIPFSLMWGGFAIMWEVGVVVSGAPPLFVLWGIPFVAVGIYMIFGRIPLARREAKRTLYAVTDRRVIIVTGSLGQRLVEIALTDLPPTQLEVRGVSLGTITFGVTMGAFRAPPGWPTMGMYAQAPAFTLIPDAARVYQILQDAKAAARRS